jgi:formylglycine-generating enzyme required for sulfatase activity
VLPGEDGTPVTAVPEEGFAFVNWSDGSILNPRTDTAVGASISVTANFTSLFALSYSAGEGGTLVGETSQFVPEGGNGSPVTAVRNEGFIFQQWSDGSTDNPRTDLNVTADISVTASFARIYTLTYNATAGGTLDGATLQSVLGGEDGTPVTAIPGEGFVFTGWSDGNTDNPRTDLDVMANLTVTANFVAQFTLNYAAGNNGTLTGETTQIVNAGSSGTPVTAVASEGFGFVAWSDGRTDNPRTDTNVQENLSVTASFATSVFLTYAAGPNGTLTGNVEQEIGAGGTSSAVTAVPNEGFLFNRWSDGRVDNPRVDEEVTSNLSVTAEFVEAFTLSYSAEENGSLTGTTTQIVKRGAAGTAVTAVPSAGFAFRRWSDGSTQNPRTDVNVLADLSVSASFIQLFSVTYTAGPNGSITGSRVQSVRDGMDGRPVTAVPNENFGFLGWSDGRLDNPRTDLNVAANISVTANFGTDVTITYVAGENGALTGTTTQEVSVGDSTTPVTAVPDEGHVFLQWNDGSTQNPRSDAFVNATVNLTASFLKIPVMLHVPAGTFTMGRLDEGDDGTFGLDDELPRRDVTLSEYEIGKYEISVREYNEFLNYLHHPSRNLLRRQDNQVWEGPTMGDLYYERGGFHMIYSGRLGETETIYNPETRLIEPKPLPGLPEGTIYSMIDHPVNQPTWYGAALYTNWLSERAGLEPVYDPDTWEADFTKNGYRLPTEAEWERAAAWDGEKHWIYPITSDTLEGRARVNYHDGPPVPTTEDPLLNTYFVNPLGLVQTRITAFTSPVGWFNGINISPNRNIQTIDSKSPVGAYDMAGNLIEWCQDWYDPGYYAVGGTVDPMGPDGGTHKVARGGAWGRTPMAPRMRSSARYSYLPTFTDGIIGFRIARSVR